MQINLEPRVGKNWFILFVPLCDGQGTNTLNVFWKQIHLFQLDVRVHIHKLLGLNAIAMKKALEHFVVVIENSPDNQVSSQINPKI